MNKLERNKELRKKTQEEREVAEMNWWSNLEVICEIKAGEKKLRRNRKRLRNFCINQIIENS